MAAAPKRKPAARPSFSFVVTGVEDADGMVTLTVGEVTGTLEDEFDVALAADELLNGYLNIIDRMNVEDGNVDDDEVDEPEPAPVKKPAPRRK